jgi:hypothetical protein
MFAAESSPNGIKLAQSIKRLIGGIKIRQAINRHRSRQKPLMGFLMPLVSLITQYQQSLA